PDPGGVTGFGIRAVLTVGKPCYWSMLLEICPRGNNKCSYYYIFVFMINVYIHAIIVLTRKH
ncbi:hypothetical protein Q8G50_34895, partial [Klebsiella pneumoniae]